MILGQLDAILSVGGALVNLAGTGFNAYMGYQQIEQREDQLKLERQRIQAQIDAARRAAEAEMARQDYEASHGGGSYAAASGLPAWAIPAGVAGALGLGWLFLRR